jgi:hypothetical protein
MKFTFNINESISHSFEVLKVHFPDFGSGVIHMVCATYKLVKEWTTKQFVIKILDKDKVLNITSVKSIVTNEIRVSYDVCVDNRTIARGKTGQKVNRIDKINSYLSSLES